MVYNVIGLMSGSSLDGLDICFVQLEESRGKWSAEIIKTDCIAYSDEWVQKLKTATQIPVPEFLKLHSAYGHYLGKTVREFMEQNELDLRVHFIASHGHTIWHEPKELTSFQLGDGASIAAVLDLPVISDLRSIDIALGGQGAPIVPIGDKLLFGDYDALLNIGGICNVSVKNANGEYCAFDISVANQALNYLAQKAGKAFDKNGELAKKGQLIESEFLKLNEAAYYQKSAPKSLSNEQAMALVGDFIKNETYSIEDRLHTMVQFIAAQISSALLMNMEERDGKTILATGGGALNTFLMDTLQNILALHGISIEVPDEQIVQYKEAIVMALIGTLRWREETNILCTATGARRNSVSGAYWMGN